MALFSIRTDLFLEEVREGVMLTYLCPPGRDGTGDLFSIGLSHQSVQACNMALSQEQGLWEIKDRSLKVANEKGEVTLHFRMQGPPFERRQLVLRGKDAGALKRIFEQLARKRRAS